MKILNGYNRVIRMEIPSIQELVLLYSFHLIASLWTLKFINPMEELKVLIK